MTRTTLSIVVLSVTLASWLGTVSAQAQSRVFVAAQGSDGNPCTFALPCRTFQHAHDVVASNGEIDVLDPAGYGALTITKAVSIQGHGFSGISAPSGNAIAINAGANDIIGLRGLLIDGVGSGTAGIVFNSGAYLEIHESLIRNFVSKGILFQPAASAGLLVSATNVSSIRQPVTASARGIDVAPTGGTVTGVFDRVIVENVSGIGINIYGVVTTGTLDVTISNSVIARNASNGITCWNNTASTECTVQNSTLANNFAGLVASGNSAAILRVTRSAIIGNGYGWAVGSGTAVIESFGDNAVRGNTTDGSPTATVALQ